MTPRLLLRSLAAAIAASLTTSSAVIAGAGSPVPIDDAPHEPESVSAVLVSGATARYIVQFAEAPVARYNEFAARGGVNGIAAIPSRTLPNGRTHVDVQSTQAVAYTKYVQSQQQRHLGEIASALGQTIEPRYTMQHALNAVVLELDPRQAAAVAQLPGVAHVERDRSHELASDIGPTFLGAPWVWWGAPAAVDSLFAGGFDASGGSFGDGIVIGDIDTGYNSLSPSFQATDAKGYSVKNPLGHGKYLGQCSVPKISLAGCNDKVIGVYDELDLTQSAGAFTAYSVEDKQGHGSHTASTAAGDFRSATLGYYTTNISGVAPHANLVIYYACSPNKAIACTTAATTAAVDQAIQDGVVDALNYSISGGTDAWNDATSQAFLSASAAGIFVAAAAGNSGNSVPIPVPGTTNHWEPWVTTVAAATHTGGPVGPKLAVTGPGNPPAEVQSVALSEAVGDTPNDATLNLPLTLSATFHNGDLSGSDACGLPAGNAKYASVPADAFKGSLALVSRGTCAFVVKVQNAIAAGALGVIIADNRAGLLPTFTVAFADGSSQPVPVWGVTQAAGGALQTWLGANSNVATTSIPFPARMREDLQPDVLANFSLLGPAGIDVIKPDVQAPGYEILAAVANDGSAEGPDKVDLYFGTSMATPHTTGSGALLLAMHPNWTPYEVKSALMMTAKEAGLTKPNAVTPSDPYDRGSGRLQDYPASRAGLVLNETAANFDFADPALGGDASSLNLASMQSSQCILACDFVRTFTSAAKDPVHWSVGVSGEIAPLVLKGADTLTLPPGTSTQLAIEVDSTALPSNGSTHFGELTLTPDVAGLSPLHLPIAVRVPPPTLALQPDRIDIAGVGGGTASAFAVVSNIGGPSLALQQDTQTTSAGYSWIAQPTPANDGYASTQYAGRETGATNYYAADDFSITGVGTVDLSLIAASGFTRNSLASFGPGVPLHWRIYSDVNGHPSGNPDDPTSTPLWKYDAKLGSPGVRYGGGPLGADIVLDLTAAVGAPPTALPAGHYWLSVYPTLPCLGVGNGCTNGQWYWLVGPAHNGATAQTIAPQAKGSETWAPIDTTTGYGFAFTLQSRVSCVPPAWMTTIGLPATVGARSSTGVVVSASPPLGAPAATAYLCLQSNDPKYTGPLPIQVDATQ